MEMKKRQVNQKAEAFKIFAAIVANEDHFLRSLFFDAIAGKRSAQIALANSLKGAVLVANPNSEVNTVTANLNGTLIIDDNGNFSRYLRLYRQKMKQAESQNTTTPVIQTETTGQ